MRHVRGMEKYWKRGPKKETVYVEQGRALVRIAKTPRMHRKEKQRKWVARAAKKEKKKMEDEEERGLDTVPNASILSESTQNTAAYCENKLKNYVVRTKLELAAITTFTI